MHPFPAYHTWKCSKCRKWNRRHQHSNWSWFTHSPMLVPTSRVAIALQIVPAMQKPDEQRTPRWLHCLVRPYLRLPSSRYLRASTFTSLSLGSQSSQQSIRLVLVFRTLGASGLSRWLISSWLPRRQGIALAGLGRRPRLLNIGLCRVVDIEPAPKVLGQALFVQYVHLFNVLQVSIHFPLAGTLT